MSCGSASRPFSCWSPALQAPASRSSWAIRGGLVAHEFARIGGAVRRSLAGSFPTG